MVLRPAQDEMTAFNSKERFQTVVAQFLQNKQKWVILRCCFAANGLEINKDLKITCTANVLLIESFVWCSPSLICLSIGINIRTRNDVFLLGKFPNKKTLHNNTLLCLLLLLRRSEKQP